MILPFLPSLLITTKTTTTRSNTSSLLAIKFLLIYVIKSVTTLLDENSILITGNNNNNLTKVTIIKNGEGEPLPMPEAFAAPEPMDDGLPIFPERPDAVYFIVAGKCIDINLVINI